MKFIIIYKFTQNMKFVLICTAYFDIISYMARKGGKEDFICRIAT